MAGTLRSAAGWFCMSKPILLKTPYNDVPQEFSLLMAFTMKRLLAKAGEDGPKKPEEIVPPKEDRDNPQSPPELPTMPGVREIDRPGGGDEVGPVVTEPEMPVLPQEPEVGVPPRGDVLH